MNSEISADAAVESIPLPVESTTFELNEPFEREAKARSRGKDVSVYHRLRRPTLQELQARDDSQPYRSQDIGNDEEQVLADTSGRADMRLYDLLVVETRGYSKNVAAGQTEDERRAALATVHPAHKVDMIRAILAVQSEVVFDDDEDEIVETFLFGDGATYRVKSELFDAGQFVVYSTLNEPTQRQIEAYTAGATKFTLEKGQRKPVTKITVSLTPAVELFDKLVESIEGLTVNGNPIDVKDVRQLALVDPYLKRSAVDALMKETRLNMGK
jgi:hypothetical protein